MTRLKREVAELNRLAQEGIKEYPSPFEKVDFEIIEYDSYTNQAFVEAMGEWQEMHHSILERILSKTHPKIRVGRIVHQGRD